MNRIDSRAQIAAIHDCESIESVADTLNEAAAAA
jgi:hypothetical protein